MSPKKRQTVLKAILCHYWGKYNVKNNGFTLESAHHLLETLQSKKADNSVKAKLKIFDSGFKLINRGAFRRTYKIPYDSIIRFFVFKTEPHLIILGVERRKRFYHYAILFRELDHVNEVCDFIERKKCGSVIVNNTQTPQIVISHQEVVHSSPRIEETSYEIVNHEMPSEKIEKTYTYSENTANEPMTPKIVRNSAYQYDERHTNDMGTNKIDALLLRTSKYASMHDDQWKEDMQYLDYNPSIGTATITEYGPIYMYTAHFTPADYNNFGSCESDESDSWSGDSMSSSDHLGMDMRNYDGKPRVIGHRNRDNGIIL